MFSLINRNENLGNRVNANPTYFSRKIEKNVLGCLSARGIAKLKYLDCRRSNVCRYLRAIYRDGLLLTDSPGNTNYPIYGAYLNKNYSPIQP